jgi:hypothetical protein
MDGAPERWWTAGGERTIDGRLPEGCAERHADADLLGSLGDGVRDYAVDAEGCEEESEE